MINISEKILVALEQAAPTALPSSQICPIGTSSGERKKLETLKNRNPTAIEYDNKPLPGFTLTKSGRTSWGSTETVWTIIDPRGFKSLITSSNLEKILHYTGITEGLIQEKCVWARENERTTMILIPTNSDEYAEAIANTELIANKVSKSDINLGDKVLLQNKLEGKYLGTASFYSVLRNSYKDSSLQNEVTAKRSVIQLDNGAFYYQADLKILKVIDPIETPITKDEAIELIRKEYSNGTVFSQYEHVVLNPKQNKNSYDIDAKFISNVHVAARDIKYEFEEVDAQEAETLFLKGFDDMDPGTLLIEDVHGKKYIVDQPTSSYDKKNMSPNVASFTASEIIIKDGKLLHEPVAYDNRKKRYGYYYYNNRQDEKKKVSLKNFIKYYKIVKKVKKESYV